MSGTRGAGQTLVLAMVLAPSLPLGPEAVPVFAALAERCDEARRLTHISAHSTAPLTVTCRDRWEGRGSGRGGVHAKSPGSVGSPELKPWVTLPSAAWRDRAGLTTDSKREGWAGGAPASRPRPPWG